MSSTSPATAVESLSHNSASESSPWLVNPALVDRVQRALKEANVTFGGFYTPLVALAAWLWQTLHSMDCQAAVAWLTLHFEELQKAASIDSGNYCRARAKLPVAVLRRVVVDTARETEQAALEKWLWRKRHVYLADGTTSSMPDTPENQAEYPQPKTQKPGCGFPIVRIVKLFSLATGMVHDAAFAPYAGKQTGEPALFRKVIRSIPTGSVVVADRFYCSYWMVAAALAQGLDVALRLHASRKDDFRQGKRLGHNDRQVVWIRPARPPWMSPEEYEQIPETLTVRMVRKTIHKPGVRVRNLVIVTTLDHETYSADDVIELYGRRWTVELDIRDIKSTMKMDPLRCKSPENVRREIWIHLLAYNLCREQSILAARQAGLTPREISLKSCKKTLELHSSQLPCFLAPDRTANDITLPSLIQQLGGERVGNRPDRYEPRKVKRRPKAYPLLNEPREVARAKMAAAPSG